MEHSERSERRGRRRSEAIDAKCIEAAVAILVEEGARGVGFDAVARRAGVSVPAVYRRWSSPEALLLDAVRKVSLEAAQRTDGLPPYSTDGLPFAEALRQALRRISEIYSEKNVRACMMSVASLASSDPVIGAGLERFKREWEEGLSRIVAQIPMPPGVSSGFLSGMIMGPVFYRSLMLGQRLSEHEIGMIADFVVAGFRSARWRD